VFVKPPGYDKLELDLDMLRDALGENLEYPKWENNRFVIIISRMEVAHNNNVS